jgi:hypothetical protein
MSLRVLLLFEYPKMLGCLRIRYNTYRYIPTNTTKARRRKNQRRTQEQESYVNEGISVTQDAMEAPIFKDDSLDVSIWSAWYLIQIGTLWYLLKGSRRGRGQDSQFLEESAPLKGAQKRAKGPGTFLRSVPVLWLSMVRSSKRPRLLVALAVPLFPPIQHI